MPRTHDDALHWMQQGTELVAEALAGLDEARFAGASALPGWTRKHLVAHLAANADAVANLVHWAATGETTPMYSSAEQRNADIEAGSGLPGEGLAAWFDRSAARLAAGMDALTSEQWRAEVVTAQGRTVPATETPWMRTREVMVHAVDLDAGIGFADLPADFLAALCDDVVGKRSGAAGTPAAGPALTAAATDADLTWHVAGDGEPVLVQGTLAALTAYLTGRGSDGVSAPQSTRQSTSGNDAVPTLPAWL